MRPLKNSAPAGELDVLFDSAGLEKRYSFTSDPREAADGADVFYTDVWVSMGKESEKAERIKTMSPYQVNEKLVALGSKDSIFMHCLPAHSGEEVTEGVLRSEKSIVFDQAENRLHVQKAIVSWLVNKNRSLA